MNVEDFKLCRYSYYQERDVHLKGEVRLSEVKWYSDEPRILIAAVIYEGRTESHEQQFFVK